MRLANAFLIYTNLLIALRKKSGYSQQELADLLSLTRQTISNWENGQSAPTFDKAIELAAIYHISLDDLVGHRRK